MVKIGEIIEYLGLGLRKNDLEVGRDLNQSERNVVMTATISMTEGKIGKRKRRQRRKGEEKKRRKRYIHDTFDFGIAY